MNSIFALSLTSSLILAMLCPIFSAMVNRCSDFKFNRTSMLAGIAFAVIVPALFPLVPLHSGPVTFPGASELTLPATSVETGSLPETSADAQPHGNLVFWVLCLYWAGVMALLIREIMAYIRLTSIIYKSDKERMGNCIVCKHGDQGLSPFSWGKYIVVADKDIEPAILAHEKAHTYKRHWIDGTIVNLFSIFLWYNPAVWMLNKLIKLNHEYEADAKVIESDSDILRYQRLLIAKAIGHRTLPIANSFAISNRDFRKRVLKMSQPHSSPLTGWIIAAMTAPVVALAMYANATPFSQKILDSFKNYDFNVSDSDFAHQPVKPEQRMTYTEAEYESREVPVTVIIQVLPSPITNPEPLLKRFEISFNAADEEVLPDRIIARIEADEEGNIVSATTDYDDNPAVRVAVDRATNGLKFEVMKENGKSIRTRFVFPIRKSDLPY